MTAQGVNTAASHAHIAEEQLDHRHRADVLRTHGVLRPAQRVQERCGFVFGAGFCDVLTDFQEISLRCTADVFHHVRRVAGNVLFQQIPHAARVLQRNITFGEAFFIQLVVPAGFVILAFIRVVAREQAIFEAIILTHDQAGVGVGLGIFAVEFFVIQQVQHDA